MKLRPIRAVLSVALATSSVFLSPLSALAQECATDSDCQHGFSCEVTGAVACGGVACAPGSDCPPPPPCDPVEFRSCVPARDCEADSDCASGMVCELFFQTDCADVGASTPPPACPPGTACLIAPEPPGECSQRSVYHCTPRSSLPCSQDADCGEGFSCEEIIEEWCSGGGSAPTEPTPNPRPSGDGEADSSGAPAAYYPPPDEQLPPEGECGTTPTGRFQCVLKEITCEYNSDCPDSWLCKVTGTNGVSCSEVGPDGASSDVNCGPIAPPQEPAKTCVPPYYDYYGNVPVGGGTPDGTSDNSSSPPPRDPTTGPAAGTPNPTTMNEGASPPREENGAKDGADDDVDASGSGDDGCQIAYGQTGSSAALLVAMLGIFGAARRRRRA